VFEFAFPLTDFRALSFILCSLTRFMTLGMQMNLDSLVIYTVILCCIFSFRLLFVYDNVYFAISCKITAGNILPLGEPDWWLSRSHDKDDTVIQACHLCHVT